MPISGPGEGYWKKAKSAIRLPDELGHITPAEVAAAQTVYPNGAFWVYGYFTYFDLLNQTVQYKFLARWDLRYGFVLEQRANYT